MVVLAIYKSKGIMYLRNIGVNLNLQKKNLTKMDGLKLVATIYIYIIVMCNNY